MPTLPRATEARDNPSGPPIRWKPAVASAALVAVGSFALAVPWALYQWVLSPDTLEYIGIAYNWVNGQGFVSPVLYSYYLPGEFPPIHGMALRAPIPSLVLVPWIALGATVPQLQVIHCFTSSLIAGAGVLVARRLMSLSAALAFGIALGWSDHWLRWSLQVLSEPTAIGVLFALVAVLPWAARNVRGAAVFGALIGLAWLTRPNLGVMLGAFGAAILMTEGWRAIASRRLWAAVGTFLAIFAAVNGIMELSTGLAPYAHYGLLPQALQIHEAALYQREWTGVWSYVSTHGEQVRAALAAMHRGTLEMWFVTPRFHFLGWLAVPAWIYAFFRHPRSFASMVIAWAALAFIAVVATFYAGYEPERLSLPAVVCMLFLIAQMLDDLGRWTKRRLPERWKRVPVAHIPLIAAVVVMALFPGQTIGNARRSIDSFNRQGMKPPVGIFRELPGRMCAAMDRNALVAAANPWNVQLWCGNAAFWLPPDLDSQEVLDRYLAEIRPAFIVANTGRPRLWPKQADPTTRNAVFESAPQLQKIVAGSGLAIYRVLEPKPYEPGWTAPPPLVRMGVE